VKESIGNLRNIRNYNQAKDTARSFQDYKESRDRERNVRKYTRESSSALNSASYRKYSGEMNASHQISESVSSRNLLVPSWDKTDLPKDELAEEEHTRTVCSDSDTLVSSCAKGLYSFHEVDSGNAAAANLWLPVSV